VSSTVVIVIGVVAGFIAGGLVVWLLGARRRHEPTVGQLKAENERFREEVNAHFVRSAQLINELTDSYKKVFDHLSDGAERLVDPKTMRERMPQVGRQEVRLRHIGSSSAGDSSSGDVAVEPPADFVSDSRSRDKGAHTERGAAAAQHDGEAAAGRAGGGANAGSETSRVKKGGDA